MIASVGVIEPSCANPVAMVMPRLPIEMPMIAVINGNPAATSEPNVIIRTTAATAMPTSSLAPPGASTADAAEPLTCTVNPASRPTCAAAPSESRSSSVTSL